MITKRKITYLCNKCNMSFDSRESCRSHEDYCGSTLATQIKLVYSPNNTNHCSIYNTLVRSLISSLGYLNYQVTMNGVDDVGDEEKISVWTYCEEKDIKATLAKLVNFVKVLVKKHSLFINAPFEEELNKEVKEYLNRLNC